MQLSIQAISNLIDVILSVKALQSLMVVICGAKSPTLITNPRKYYTSKSVPYNYLQKYSLNGRTATKSYEGSDITISEPVMKWPRPV